MYARANILGVMVSAIDMRQALRAIEGWITNQEPHYVCVTPAHAIMDFYRDPALRGIANASGLTTPDGMSIVWLLRLLGHRHVRRVYGPDLMIAVCRKSVERGWRHFLYGGEPGVAEELRLRLQRRFPGLQIAGTVAPPFRPLSEQEEREIIALINGSEADIVWVGISTPKQEKWMGEHVGKVSAPVLIGVGAAFDFLSGRKRQAPRWIQRSGLEWVFRLIQEPRRLWRRYVAYPYFACLVMSQLLRLRRFPDG